ncbi:MAG: penicillin-binding protein activator LpoB [Chloroflexaceae bacterium]|nr:penicillin-binding protein activator LpoB [Chloroflexaceae bacterium]
MCVVSLPGVALGQEFQQQTPLNSLAPTEFLQAQATPITPTKKARVAVLDFDFSSISSNQILGQSISGLIPGAARGVSDILVDKLVNSGRYTVIERSQIETILKEQNLGAAGRIDASTAAQIGRILGVEAIVLGTVTKFDVEERQSGFSIGGLIGTRKRTLLASVQLNVRVVNTNTAEILVSAQGNGMADESSSTTTVIGFGGGEVTNNIQGLLSTATEQAIGEVLDDLNGVAPQVAALPPLLPTVSALIADVSRGTVIINKGAADGYRVGMVLSVERVVRTVKDPATGAVLRQISESIGQIELTQVDNSSSVGKVVSGANIAVGNVAKPVR